MRSLLAATLVSQAQSQDESSMMQGFAHRADSVLMSDSTSVHDNAKLMETATNMLKNGAGATPDVVAFINATILEIERDVLGEITAMHHADQQELNAKVAELERVASANEAAKPGLAAATAVFEGSSNLHKQCRQQESIKCGESRKCERELHDLWSTVKTQEADMRGVHALIHQDFCVDPDVHVQTCLPCMSETDCWDWPNPLAMEGPETSQTTGHYPEVDYCSDIRDFRATAKENFERYIEEKQKVEEAWDAYNTQLLECARLETELEAKVAECDDKQDDVSSEICTLSQNTRDARRHFGQELRLANEAYDLAAGVCTTAAGDSCDINAVPPVEGCGCTGIRQKEFDRRREWETLHIVICLLNTVYTHVVHAIETDEPCPTMESHPDETQAEINYCHVVEEHFTANMTIDYCGDDLPLECPCREGGNPEQCEPPPVVESRCSAAYIWETQGHFGDFMSDHHLSVVNAELEDYHVDLSGAGWGGCASPKACTPCLGHDADPPNLEYTAASTECEEHDLQLALGESDRDTFRCHDSRCVPMEGRCNRVDNCGDGSDEWGCDTEWSLPANLEAPGQCLAGANVIPNTADDVQFFCGDGSCIPVEGRCNGHSNCPDGSDEDACPTSFAGVTLEATSGLEPTLEMFTQGGAVFHDREYTFKSLGSFAGMHFIKMHNEDKSTPHTHVQMKLRLPQPMTVYVLTTEGQTLPWLAGDGWTQTSLTGVEYSGLRMTPDKEWSEHLDPIDEEDENYGPGLVWEKTFPAGVVSMRGNGGGEGYIWTSGVAGGHGSYLISLSHPSHQHPSPVVVTSIAPLDGLAEYEHIPAGCVHGSNIELVRDSTPAECAQLCDADSECLAFEFGVDYGVADRYDPNDCQLQNRAYHADCDGRHHNLDLYVKLKPGHAEYIGCFVDDGARDLGTMVGATGNSATNTFNLCRQACGNHKYMSLQYGGECFCANAYSTSPQYIRVDDGLCNRVVEPCSSNSFNCGGTWHQAIYEIN